MKYYYKIIERKLKAERQYLCKLMKISELENKYNLDTQETQMRIARTMDYISSLETRLF